MPPIDDHPLRYELANELHARPFPPLSAPCHAAFLAIKRPQDAAARDRDADRAHLLELLDRFGADHPKPGATHFFGDLGKVRLKWESHTEFVTYTIFADGRAERPFDPVMFEVFPADWLERAPGLRVTSILVGVEELTEEEGVAGLVDDWFVAESVAVSRVLDDTAVIAGDFRIDAAGHMRFGAFVRPGTGSRRVGRIVQRLCEIETYKSMSMLGLARVRQVGGGMARLDGQMTTLTAEMTSEASRPEATLGALLQISSELENLLARNAFRFGATSAYEALVHQRIEVLREARFGGRQTFGEFMMRRFDPAMRTVNATERNLRQMADRATRAADLLRTRVDVERSSQNQKLLESMDRRAALQLRLQKTVEGFSVVAISYYAVNLGTYLVAPFAEPMGVGKATVSALLTLPVVAVVFLAVRRLRRSVE